MSDIPDSKFIALAQTDPSSFGHLYNKYYPAILRFIYRRVEDKETAYDICAEVFIKALQSISSYRDKGVPFSSWLYKIATHELYKAYKNKNTAPVLSVNSENLHLLQTQVLNDYEDCTEEKIHFILKYIAQLPPLDKELIQMRFFEQRSFKEIAEIMDNTETNVKTKTYRILDKIKRCIPVIQA